MVSGQWSVASGQWSVFSGSSQWSVVSGRWSVVVASGQWSVVSGQWSARYSQEKDRTEIERWKSTAAEIEKKLKEREEDLLEQAPTYHPGPSTAR